ncbi:hypothetical protein BDV93DRAFT_561122 [Ceratobasidium sp. AG-I]|nr:hypothetical protein BDV93DRAFT_561122 [Ceratobasidium sp. AG-I]
MDAKDAHISKFARPPRFPPNVKLALHTRVGKTRSLNFFARVDKFDSISGERETRETWLADVRDPAWSILVSLRWLITRTRSLIEYDAQFFDTCPDMTVSCTRDYQADENVPAHGIRPPGLEDTVGWNSYRLQMQEQRIYTRIVDDWCDLRYLVWTARK